MTAAAIHGPTTTLVPGPRQSRSDFGVGASEAAAAIGLGSYQRPIDKWLEKTGRREPFAGNEKTRWGNALEHVVRAHYVEKNGVTVYVPPTSMYHRELSWLRATPDGIVVEYEPGTDFKDARRLYVGPQVKSVGLRMAPAWEDGNTRTVPPDYFIQGVVEMAVCDLPRIDFAVLLGGQEYFEVTIERDGQLEADVLEQLAAFWQLVEQDRQPELDSSASFRSHLLSKVKRRVTVDASVEDITVLERWRDVAVQMKQLKAEEGTLKNKVAAALAAANANRLASPIGDVTVGAGRRTTKWRGIAEQLRDLGPAFRTVTREMTALRADLAGDGPDAPDLAAALQRVDALRAQLRLFGEIALDFDDLVDANTKVGDPVLNRPRTWTKGEPEDDE